MEIEAIYVSSYYRAIETKQYSFENHPNKENIIYFVHPNLDELSGMIHEFILEKNKQKIYFNMNLNNIKVNWDIFDYYINKIK